MMKEPMLPSLAPPERVESLTDQVYAELRKAVLAGAFLPGQRMTIREIASEMKVSPTPAREALNRLVSEGGLELGPGKTVRAPAISAARLEEIYLVRIPLETAAAELAIDALGPREIASLEEIVDRHEAALPRKDFRVSLRENQAFHFAIYEASRRPLLIQVIDAMWLRMGSMMHLLYPTYSTGNPGVRNHRAAIEAIKGKDAKRLGRAIRQDLENGRAELLRVIATLPEEQLGTAA
jgi:DNA-binding GntR family transcriptional regulator